MRGTVGPVWSRTGGIWGSLFSLHGYSVPHEDEIPFLKSWGTVGTKLDGVDFCKASRSDCPKSPLSLPFFAPFYCKLGGL